MDSEASITTVGAWVDSGGGSGYFGAGTTVTFACRLRSLSNVADIRESFAGGQLDVSKHLLMYYPLEVEELTSETPLTVDGDKYEVVGVPPLGTYDQHRVVLVRKQTGEEAG